MRHSSKHHHDATIATQTLTPHDHLRPRYSIGKRLSRLTLLVAAMSSPLYAQAVLPEAVQMALSRANLTEADISIMVTPVGDKNASHLPSPIQVIDSSKVNNDPAPTKADGDGKNAHNAISNSSHQSTLITIEKRTIEQHEKTIHAYTDDPYTYQSIEDVSTVLADAEKSVASQNDSVHTDSIHTDNEQSSTDKAKIKISFSPLLNHQSDIPRTPASTMKLVPSFIALDTLGADFVWYTRIYHTGIIIGDRLQGDLIIQGSGDPKMTHERLEQLLYKIQAAGVRHIDGNIIIDSAVFKNISKDPAAFDNAPLRPYNASPDGFLVNFSTIGIKTYPLDNGQASLTYEPMLANYQLPSTIATRTASCGSASYSLAPQWQSQQLSLNTNLPDSCREHAFYVAYPDAKDFAARVVASKWKTLGNTLSGQVVSNEIPYDVTKTPTAAHGLTAIAMSPLPLVSYPSLTLTQQIYDINHFSNNVMAEQVALSIGAYGKPHIMPSVAPDNKTHDDKTNTVQTHSGERALYQQPTQKLASLYQFGKPTTTDYPAALQTINQWWQTTLQTPAPYLTNGSGLCRDCTITAANLSELLAYAYDRPSFDAYVNSLGVAGVSGTITTHSERLPESAAIGRAWIKTGTLNNVTSMAGYVKGLSGQDYVVVGIINTEEALNAYTARPVLDALLDWTAKH
ncbi:D-alanyl-D-alanine carboxypeptidase [Psychrobacter sp. NG254]|uniref:D-alanyl-D-alanine carboxypeptidase/D-alanyl-D-alanine-endopeptidase n=1 Tax=Psychrobacter sp. NG254 TaxID=2782003 RepID=UPI001887A363|nr:D-alanyl-D-alanine carboxypeptidase [Psychrobacter sp. NG254]MBF2720615.1 D-alanyl-D-alanine carboxypeptidase [Psychrobacter sp. NG254]